MKLETHQGPGSRAVLKTKMHAWLSSPLGLAVLLFAVHGLNDQYNSYLGALMPVLMEHYGFSLSVGGILAAVSSLSTSLFQPVFGYLLDKSPCPPNLFLWPMITSMATCAIGLAPSVMLVVPLLVIAGLSTAAFHPHASSMVPKSSSAGLAMALFISGGTVGYALGPVASLWVAKNYGLGSLWVLALPTLVISFLATGVIPRQERPLRQGGFPSLRMERGKFRVLFSIWMIVVLRSTVGTAYSTFMSVHLKNIGFPLVRIGVGLLLYTISGAVGSIAGGHFSDRFGRKTAITFGLLGILPSYLLILRTSGIWTWIMLVIAGFMMSSFNPVTVVMAQDLFPDNRGTAAGIIMGLGWSIGGFLVSLVGAAADRYGLVTTLQCVSLLIIPALLISFTLPGKYMRSDTRAA